MKLVVQNGGVRHLGGAGVAKRLPHVHDHQSYLAALLRPQPLEEQVKARFRTIRAAKPDGTASDQIAHPDAVGVPLADGQLVDTDDLGSRRPGPPQLLRHVLLLQRLDRLPVQMGFAGDISNRGHATSPTYPEGKPLRVEGMVGQPLQALLLHLSAASAEDPPNLHVQIDAPIATGKVPHPPHLPVVKHPMGTTAGAADRFFPRRRSRMTRAYGSPKTPTTLCSGQNPGNRYVSHRRLDFRMRISYHIFSKLNRASSLAGQGVTGTKSAFLPT